MSKKALDKIAAGLSEVLEITHVEIPMSYKAGDRVRHNDTGIGGDIIGIGDINGRELAWIKYEDADGDEQQIVFPTDELSPDG